MEVDEAMKCVATVMAAFPKPEFTDEGVALWTRMLGDLDFAECMAAIERHICTNKWQPTIAEIREEARKGNVDMPSAEIAWGEVRKCISSKGRNRTPQVDFHFSTPEIAAAVDSIGWQSICNNENESSTRARFIDTYRSIFSSEVRREVLGPRNVGGRALPGHTTNSTSTKQLMEKYKTQGDEG